MTRSRTARLSALIIAFLLCGGSPSFAADRPGISTGTTLDSQSPVDKALVGRWELTHMLNQEGGEERPKDGMRTLLELMGNGEIFFSKNDSESRPIQRHNGIYSAEKSEMTVTDAKGNTSKWPYEVNGDLMVFIIPEKGQKFYWRRTTIDKRFVGKWELTHMIDEEGQEQPPTQLYTFLELTEQGELIFSKNRMDSNSSDKRTSRCFVTKKVLVVTDEQGATSRWPYEMNGDMMVLTMTKSARTYHWRRCE